MRKVTKVLYFYLKGMGRCFLFGARLNRDHSDQPSYISLYSIVFGYRPPPVGALKNPGSVVRLGLFLVKISGLSQYAEGVFTSRQAKLHTDPHLISPVGDGVRAFQALG